MCWWNFKPEVISFLKHTATLAWNFLFAFFPVLFSVSRLEKLCETRFKIVFRLRWLLLLCIYFHEHKRRQKRKTNWTTYYSTVLKIIEIETENLIWFDSKNIFTRKNNKSLCSFVKQLSSNIARTVQRINSFGWWNCEMLNGWEEVYENKKVKIQFERERERKKKRKYLWKPQRWKKAKKSFSTDKVKLIFKKGFELWNKWKFRKHIKHKLTLLSSVVKKDLKTKRNQFGACKKFIDTFGEKGSSTSGSFTRLHLDWKL